MNLKIDRSDIGTSIVSDFICPSCFEMNMKYTDITSDRKVVCEHCKIEIEIVDDGDEEEETNDNCTCLACELGDPEACLNEE